MKKNHLPLTLIFLIRDCLELKDDQNTKIFLSRKRFSLKRKKKKKKRKKKSLNVISTYIYPDILIIICL